MGEPDPRQSGRTSAHRTADSPAGTPFPGRDGGPDAGHERSATASTSAAARERLAQYGPNELAERDRKSVWRMLWEQLSATLVVVLIVAAVVSAALGDFTDAVAILAIVVLNTVLGLFHEQRAERAMAMLKRLAVPIVRARRDGAVVELPSRDLVPGDIVLLEAGRRGAGRLPAGRVREPARAGGLAHRRIGAGGQDLPGRCPTPSLPLGDRRNMVYMGTDRHLRARAGRRRGDGHARPSSAASPT